MTHCAAQIWYKKRALRRPNSGWRMEGLRNSLNKHYGVERLSLEAETPAVRYTENEKSERENLHLQEIPLLPMSYFFVPPLLLRSHGRGTFTRIVALGAAACASPLS
ncbi:hypothetical protein E2C01_059678 [Portunus trituberculatus]|uniref:Uncharacterized protein n=1 Tax=Portunus trituberculatus TaxID=210409 RepID=A0A5B7GZ17_PORTR|nr:hypothetical protein [Portunus trituberculatus]